MKRSSKQLRDDALAIWRAGVDAVQSDRLVREHVRVEEGWLIIGDESIALDDIRRIVVVGAGKAGAGMAAGLEASLGENLMAEKNLSGWINVPAKCLRTLRRIKLHAARPAGVNEPTEEGVRGANRILEMVGGMTADDLCLCLISGGGSALLPAPVDGISLADKLILTKQLSAAGANIRELNTVRKQLSRIKGGGILRACPAGRLVTLIISDVIGDPLDVIASGPTVVDTSSSDDALAVLDKFGSRQAGVPPHVFEYLQQATNRRRADNNDRRQVDNFVIGNNATAVDAAGSEAERRGYSHATNAARELEGAAEEVGRHLADMALRMRYQSGPDCLITGGEPTVQLAPESERGVGGRNQQLVLAALDALRRSQDPDGSTVAGIVLLSGGTDGEDGPTDAAGAIIDEHLAKQVDELGIDPSDYLRRNDAYGFFERVGGLIKTGPTHTNVCDLRVVVVDRMVN